MAAIALVVGNSAALTAGDTDLQSLLAGAGHTVTVVDDGAAVAGGQALHFITESGSPAVLGTKYRNLSTPVISLEVGGWDDQLWINTNGTNQGSGTTWDLQTHAITSGLADPLTIYTASSGRYGAANTAFGAGVEILAVHPTVTTAYVAFAYDVGDTLSGGTAAAGRQVGAGVIDNSADVMSTGLQTFILNAVTWALSAGTTSSLPIAAETDTAPPFTATKTAALGTVIETDASRPLTGAKAGTLPVVAEADTARPLIGGKTGAIPQISETDSATALTGSKTGALPHAAELDTAQPLISGPTTADLPTATETDTAFGFAAVKAAALAAAAEVDAAQQLAGGKLGVLPIALEFDQALPLTVGGAPGRDITVVDETEPVTGWLADTDPTSGWSDTQPTSAWSDTEPVLATPWTDTEPFL